MLRSVLRKFGKYLITLSSDQAPAKPRRPPVDKFEFARRARRATSQRGGRHLLAGSVQLLGLDKICEELGVEGSRLSAAAYNIVEETIAKHLSDEDTYARRSDETFVLCFGSMDREAVETRMASIFEEVKFALAGAVKAPVRVTHDLVDIEIVDIDDNSILDEIAEALKRVRSEAENAARVWRQQMIRTAAVRYRPVWSTRKKIVAIHRAMFDEETGRKMVQKLSALSSVDEINAVLFDLDCLILGRAAAGLHDLVVGGGRTQLIVPVNFNSMNVKARREHYLKLCEDIPQAYRRYILFEVRDIPDGTPANRILELAVPLRTYAHGILVEAPLMFTEIAAATAGSVVIGMATHADQLVGSITENHDRLTCYTKSLTTRNIRAFLHGVDTAAMARAAIAAGIEYMDGAAIAEPTRELKSIYNWTPA